MQLVNTLLLLSSVASTAFGVIHQVKVSIGGALAYEPNSITAAVGDQVEFQFLNGNHSVVQAPFGTPCVPSPSGFFSGFLPGGAGKPINAFTIDVKSTDAVWFYCAQAKHCQAGMVGVINVNKNSNKTLEAFAAAAKLAPANVAPSGGLTGGVISQLPPAGNGTVTPPTAGKPPVATATTNAAMGAVSGSQATGLLSLLLVAGLLL
ncbi:MAG: hypothetical protein M1840_004027 [Geoglossum simile]|nr:MAG: hypothetical protein M1840_004027 [Geoglossum simile]